MSKRGKATTRAVSPDIVSLSTCKKVAKAKGKNANVDKTTEEGEQQELAALNYENDEIQLEEAGEAESENNDVSVETEVKRKRGRPKKVLPSGPNLLSPDINPRNGKKNVRKGQNAKKKLIEDDASSNDIQLEEITPLPPSPEVPMGLEHLSLQPAEDNPLVVVSDHMESVVQSPDITSVPSDEVAAAPTENEIVPPPLPTQEQVRTEEVIPAAEPSHHQPSSFFGGSGFLDSKYRPGFIPGLDVEETEENSSNKLEGGSFSFGSVMAKKVLSMEKQATLEREPKSEERIDKFDESDSKIRRSSRIKSLEETRGPRKRREVVFSGPESVSSSRSQSVAGDDDSNSNSSFIMNGETGVSNSDEVVLGDDSSRSQTEFSSLGLSATALSFINMLPPSSTSSSNGSSLKPLKVKSRWRYSLDAESLKSSESSLDSSTMMLAREPLTDTSNVAPLVTAVNFRPVSPPLGPNMVKKPGFIVYDSTDEELSEKLKKFQGIEESVFFTERKVSKESKYMICDCYLSKEDIQRGEVGCNEDCLNRLLMVECGSRCPTGDRCTNRKFQRKEYSKLEVFKTEKKGHGLRTLVPVPVGGFVIEYVGEVLSPRGFAQRTKEYAKDKQEHFYFMALRSDTIIDATQKGNCSRFINHSCEPNCETQKWTVNGELRVGFFAQRDLEAGEEITFDYQFQRYGKKAQKCFCLSEKCRGWIGGDEEEGEEDDGENKEPDLDDLDEEIEERKPKVKVPRRKKKQARTSGNEFGDRFDEELAMLEKSGLKNRNHTLALCRLMVRAEDWDAREKLLTILTSGDQPCRRLFLDYHGLSLLHGWMSTLPLPMSDSSNNLITNDSYHILFLKALASLPIPNKTMLSDSQVLPLVEKWSDINPIREECKPDIKVDTTSEPESEVKSELLKSDASLEPSQSDPSLVAVEVEIKEESETVMTHDDSTVPEVKPMEVVEEVDVVVEQPVLEEAKSEPAIAEVESKTTSSPEPEVIKWEFVEGAKQLLQDWAELKEVFRIPKKERVEQMKEHEREADKGVIAPALKESAYDRDSRNKLTRKSERRVPSLDSYLPYHRSMRDYQNKYSNLSKEERRLIFAQQVAEKEKEEAKQREMQDSMVVLHQERCKVVNLDPATTPIVDPSGVYYLDPATITWKEINPEDPAVPPELLMLIHGAIFPAMPMPDQGVPVPMVPPEEPAETSFPPWPEGFPPPPPLPPPKLPSGWHIATDPDGRFYYFHRDTLEVRWVIPSPESSDISDLSSSEYSTDSEDVELEDESVDLSVSEEGGSSALDAEKVSKHLERQERRKLSGLVQERIISPRSEDDKPLLSQKAIRARKLELMAEKLHGISAEDVEEDIMSESAAATVPDIVGESEEVEDGPSVVDSDPQSDSIVTGPAEKKRKIMLSTADSVEVADVGNGEAGEVESAAVLGEMDVDGANDVRNSNDMNSVTSPISAQPSVDPVRSAPKVSKASSSKPSEKKRLHKKNKKSLDKAELAKKLKEKKSSEEYFRNQIANVIVQNLNPYRKPDCKNGRITSTEDFKHLARKLTHMVTTKEVKHCKNAKTLVVNDSVKHKTKEFVKKYMGKFGGRTYAPSPQEN